MKNTWQTFTAYSIAVFLCIFSGCATLSNDSFSSSGSSSRGGDPMMSSGTGTSGGLYYEFKDVLVPHDMRVDKNATFITSSPNFAAGVLSVKGRIDKDSLITYFDNNMAKDGWMPVTSFKSPLTKLLFRKDSRWCVISIAERDFNTYVEIWVASGGGHE